ncbi:hypothetical protein [Flavobacterium sp. CAU 1735]|uniref:hypothetical protein n=1 Tax=Flavobacterium sp. CAU 1735 TaxID=3140361 RepID=UPI00326019BD
MSANYHIRVQSVEEDTLTVAVFLADDSFGCFADEEFALRLLCSPDNVYKYDDDYNQVANCSLAEEISVDNYLDERWIVNHSIDFIANIKLVSLNNFPFDDWDYDRWSNAISVNSDDTLDFTNVESDHPGGVVAIKVLKPEHLQHFKAGDTFSTAAYSSQNMDETHYETIGNWMFSEE